MFPPAAELRRGDRGGAIASSTRAVAGALAVLLQILSAGCETASLSAVADPKPSPAKAWTPLAAPPVVPSLVPTGEGARSGPTAQAAANSSKPADAPAPSTPTALVVVREPWTWAESTGYVLRSPNYEISTTVKDESLLRDMPILMEAALVHFRTGLVELPAPRSAMRSMFFDRRTEWAAYTKRRLPQEAETYLGIGRGGYTTGGESVLYNLGRSDTFIIAVHEGWHQYTQTTFKDRLPTWLEEGMACWMEGHRFRRESAPTFAPWRNMERYGALRDAVEEGRLVSLGDLLRGTPQEALGEGRATLLGYYAQVWALVHFLNEGQGGRYAEALRRALRDAAEGTLVRTVMSSDAVPPEARRPWALARNGRWVAAAYFNPNIDELESQYRDFIRLIVADGGGNRIWKGLSPAQRDAPPAR